MEQFYHWLKEGWAGIEKQTGSESGLGPANAGEERRETDLFQLFAELSALRQEVRLESRQLKKNLAQSEYAWQQADEKLDQTKTAQESLLQEIRRLGLKLGQPDPRRDCIFEFIEIRDKIVESIHHLEQLKLPWPLRTFGAKPLIDSLLTGQRGVLRQIDTILAKYEVAPLAAIGQKFDPATMQATGVVDTPAQPDGTVVEELRTGFRAAGKILRVAEVTVNRQTRAPHQAGGSTQHNDQVHE